MKNLDLNLLAPPFYATLAGQDMTHNNTPTIGGAPSPMCPVIMFPLQYKLDVFAQSGSGPVSRSGSPSTARDHRRSTR